jgi:hypothetical protein
MNTATDHGEEVPQHLFKAIPKLVQALASHETVPSALGLKLEVVQQVLAKDPSQVVKLIESIRGEEYRCVLSDRPMTSSEMAPDGNYYEQKRFEARPTQSSEHDIPNPKLRAMILELCRESTMLEPLSERAFEEAFRCFTELLKQVALNAGAIDLLEQALEGLNSTQLRLIEQALNAQPSEEGAELILERLNRVLAETKHLLEDTRESLDRIKILQAPQLHEDTLPTFIYSNKRNTGQLHRTHLVTGEQSSHQVPSYTFKLACCWSEVPGGSLLITGGGGPAVREVVRIDTRREFAVSDLPPMLTPRKLHAAVYHSQHLYVLGGYNGRDSTECERYVCAENRWEALPVLPRGCCNLSGVVVERSVYALGGNDRDIYLDLVQKLSLESLTWELMQFRLPFADFGIPCFKLRDTEVYLVVSNTLCSFTGLEVRPLKTLTGDIKNWFGASYYCRETLYCSHYLGAVLSYEIGSLSD